MPLADQKHEDGRVTLLGLAAVAAISLTFVASIWSWFATTFPVNDGIAAGWTSTDWKQAASVARWKGVFYSLAVAAAILVVSAKLRRRIGQPSWRVALAIALASASAIFLVTWQASLTFLATRPMW
jgi:hypothetical protein